MTERQSLEFTERLNGPFIAKVRRYMKENDITTFKVALIALANKGLSK